MQDYRRKIAYLYAYEGGEKLGNAGFVKAEDRGGICRLAVHLRCYSRSAGGYLFGSAEKSKRGTGMAGDFFFR